MILFIYYNTCGRPLPQVFNQQQNFDKQNYDLNQKELNSHTKLNKFFNENLLNQQNYVLMEQKNNIENNSIAINET